MISAEISHLIAFVLVCIAAVVVGLVYSWQFGVVLMLVNIVLNLYPALLQQQNKRRIDRFINLK
ncbi:glycosyl-4,4'-diaponeurosporenoate acyltransferase CrtO family protein [Galbibacter marinus]|uniref:glycosyl-4,4'-diaponeurosporenoate acyltransferase CrtO family protein n=1 Tax=Galbibacter marinus TaxID=555500 RepID=UPI0026B4493F